MNQDNTSLAQQASAVDPAILEKNKEVLLMLKRIKGTKLTAWEVGFVADVWVRLQADRVIHENTVSKLQEISFKCKKKDAAVASLLQKCVICNNSYWLLDAESNARRCECAPL